MGIKIGKVALLRAMSDVPELRERLDARVASALDVDTLRCEVSRFEADEGPLPPEANRVLERVTNGLTAKSLFDLCTDGIQVHAPARREDPTIVAKRDWLKAAFVSISGCSIGVNERLPSTPRVSWKSEISLQSNAHAPITLTPDGSRALMMAKGTLHVFDCETGALLLSSALEAKEEGTDTAPAGSLDGKRAFVILDRKLHAVDLTTGESSVVETPHELLRSPVVHPTTGDVFAAASEGSLVKVAADGKVSSVHTGVPWKLQSPTVSPDGRYVAVLDACGNATVFSTSGLAQVSRFNPPTATVISNATKSRDLFGAFSADSEVFVHVSLENTRGLDVQTGELRWERKRDHCFSGETEPRLRPVALSDANRMLVPNHAGFDVLDPHDGSLERSFRPPSQILDFLRLSPDERFAYGLAYANSLTVFDLETGNITQPKGLPSNILNYVAGPLLPGGEFMLQPPTQQEGPLRLIPVRDEAV